MNNLTKLFRLIETSRAQPQYGYVLAEIPKSELSDLAQHHYLVTFIAWQLARMTQRAGANINLQKVLEFSLIHDLGELFGGDISMPYAKANPIAREKAKAFEAENQKYLATFFGEDDDYFQELSNEIMDVTSNEGIIAKIADYIEVTQYKLYVRRLTKGDVTMALRKMQSLAAKITDTIAQDVILKFLTEWAAELGDGQLDEIFESIKAS
jgi:5'-deoxynucleotidase YfbR-like HD superfamily hydrolase